MKNSIFCKRPKLTCRGVAIFLLLFCNACTESIVRYFPLPNPPDFPIELGVYETKDEFNGWEKSYRMATHRIQSVAPGDFEICNFAGQHINVRAYANDLGEIHVVPQDFSIASEEFKILIGTGRRTIDGVQINVWVRREGQVLNFDMEAVYLRASPCKN